jgi:hypothetical protein
VKSYATLAKEDERLIQYNGMTTVDYCVERIADKLSFYACFYADVDYDDSGTAIVFSLLDGEVKETCPGGLDYRIDTTIREPFSGDRWHRIVGHPQSYSESIIARVRDFFRGVAYKLRGCRV